MYKNQFVEPISENQFAISNKVIILLIDTQANAIKDIYFSKNTEITRAEMDKIKREYSKSKNFDFDKIIVLGSHKQNVFENYIFNCNCYTQNQLEPAFDYTIKELIDSSNGPAYLNRLSLNNPYTGMEKIELTRKYRLFITELDNYQATLEELISNEYSGNDLKVLFANYGVRAVWNKLFNGNYGIFDEDFENNWDNILDSIEIKFEDNDIYLYWYFGKVREMGDYRTNPYKIKEIKDCWEDTRYDFVASNDDCIKIKLNIFELNKF